MSEASTGPTPGLDTLAGEMLDLTQHAAKAARAGDVDAAMDFLRRQLEVRNVLVAELGRLPSPSTSS
jgi:hypothetical protein